MPRISQDRGADARVGKSPYLISRSYLVWVGAGGWWSHVGLILKTRLLLVSIRRKRAGPQIYNWRKLWTAWNY